MRIVCWIGDAPNHKALVSKISKEFNVVGVVVDRRKKGAIIPASNVFKRLTNRIRFSKYGMAWSNLQNYYYANFALPREKETILTGSINKVDVLNFTRNLTPDLVVVSGTGLIKEPLLSLQLPVGTINLHTGLSPYVKGGPNCTNWCIANNDWDLIGNTVLWLSAGIDSGNIITSEKTNIDNIKSHYGIHYCVMEHAHDLMLRTIRYIINSQPPYQSIPQADIGKGKLYLNKMWTAKMKKKLMKNLKATVERKRFNNVITVPIPS